MVGSSHIVIGDEFYAPAAGTACACRYQGPVHLEWRSDAGQITLAFDKHPLIVAIWILRATAWIVVTNNGWTSARPTVIRTRSSVSLPSIDQTTDKDDCNPQLEPSTHDSP